MAKRDKQEFGQTPATALEPLSIWQLFGLGSASDDHEQWAVDPSARWSSACVVCGDRTPHTRHVFDGRCVLTICNECLAFSPEDD